MTQATQTTQTAVKILVVDDDRDLQDMVAFALQRAGMVPVRAGDGPGALRAVEAEQPDLVLLDVQVGAWDGFELLEQLRKRTEVPVIMLTARVSEDDKVRGLRLGANDYVTKPFSYRELIARIEAHLRGYKKEGAGGGVAPAGTLEVGPLRLDAAQHVATKNGAPLNLTATEFRVLECLMRRAGTVVPSRTLMREVWGFDDPSGAETVRVTVYRLRQKLEDDPAAPALIQTVKGVGVLLKVPEGGGGGAPGASADQP